MKSIAVVSILMAVVLGLAGVCASAADNDFAAWVETDGMPFPCIAGAPCKVMVSVTNTGKSELGLGKWTVAAKPGSAFQLDIKPDPKAPKTVKPGDSAVATTIVTLPESAGGKTITLVCSVTAGDKIRRTELDILVTPKYEITLLPTRLIMGARDEARTLGVSVINHTEETFKGKLKFTAPAALDLSPTDIDATIDPLGLEAFVASVKPNNTPVPGHYTVWLDVEGKAKDWAMVDVPAVAKNTQIKIDGKLDDWQQTQYVSLSRYVDGSSVSGGIVRFAHDAKNFYVAVEVDDAKHVLGSDSKSRVHADTIVIGLDPMIDGAKAVKGGYKDDDIEYTLVGADSASVVLKTAAGSKAMEQETKLPISYKRNGGKSVYEVAIPWSEMKGFDLDDHTMLAVGVLANEGDGKAVTSYSFGGGLGANVDPRLFVPVIIGK